MTTIKQIAEKAGISYSTVSRALNRKRGVRSEVRTRVEQLAREMNYFPHSSAKALVEKRVGVIGVVIPRTSEFAFQNPFYSHMLLGLAAVAKQKGIQLLLSINSQSSYAELFHRRLVDGIVVVANRMDDDQIPLLIEQGIPTVVVPGYDSGSSIEVPSANSENYRSVYRAVCYLISLGHRDIAFILGQMNSKYTTERLAAYRAALADNALPYKPEYTVESDFSRDDAFRLMGQLLDLPQPPTSVICINDSVTPGALHQIKSRGLRVPQDVSVVAIVCSDNFEFYDPPLTTIRISVPAVGRAAATSLIQLIETGACTEQHVVISSDLIVRESTGRCYDKTKTIKK